MDRYTFDRLELLPGVSIIVMLVGLSAIPPMIGLLIDTPGAADGQRVRIEGTGLPKRWRDLIGFRAISLNSSVIGCRVGILPGAIGSRPPSQLQ